MSLPRWTPKPRAKKILNLPRWQPKPRAKKILRPKEAQKKLGVGRTKFWNDFVNTGRLRKIRLGPRAIGFLESNVDQVIDQLVAESDAESE